MRRWFRGLFQGMDGEPSVANFLLFVGGGMLVGIAVTVFIACAFKKAQWSDVVGPLEYLKDLFKWLAAPYLAKKFGNLFTRYISPVPSQLVAPTPDIRDMGGA